MDGGTWGAIVHRVARIRHDLATKHHIDSNVIVMELFSYFKILLKQNDWRIFVVLFAFITFQFSCILKASGSLTNTVETVPLFEALKPYIHSEKAPQILVDFLNNSLSDAYLFPVYSFQYLFTVQLCCLKAEKKVLLKYSTA